MTQITTHLAAAGHVRRGEIAPRAVSTLQRLRECEWRRRGAGWECSSCGAEQHEGHWPTCSLADCIAEFEAREHKPHVHIGAVI